MSKRGQTYAQRATQISVRSKDDIREYSRQYYHITKKGKLVAPARQRASRKNISSVPNISPKPEVHGLKLTDYALILGEVR